MTFVIVKLLDGTNANEILDERSQNMVSFYFMCYVILFYIGRIKSGKIELPLYPAILLLILSLLMFGRSGIALSVLLFLGMLYYKLAKQPLSKALKIISVILISTVALLYLNREGIKDFMDISLSRFDKEGSDLTGRSEIWTAYFKQFSDNFSYALFGVPLDSEPIFLYFDRNVHNS
ncbi:MAG TPA: hypothetical protein VN040_06810, partial [Pseudosphingobacterium sp.]|nr:hypothetical protein [Pseudosphingobacterium sp.]